MSLDTCVPKEFERPKPQPRPEPVRPNPIPAPTCTPNDKQPFYYAVVPYDTAADYEPGFNALFNGVYYSSLPGAEALAGQLRGAWPRFNSPKDKWYPQYAGWAFQAQRTIYYDSHRLATYVRAEGVPDIAINWNTQGNPPRLDAVETKWSGTGQGYVRSLQTSPSEFDRYQAIYPGRWLLEVNTLTAVGELELRKEGGQPFETALYP